MKLRTVMIQIILMYSNGTDSVRAGSQGGGRGAPQGGAAGCGGRPNAPGLPV